MDSPVRRLKLREKNASPGKHRFTATSYFNADMLGRMRIEKTLSYKFEEHQDIAGCLDWSHDGRFEF